MKNVIFIYGASGSGTTTLARAISDELGYKFMDTDDYFWLPTNPPFTDKRERSERVALMENDIKNTDNAVISGALDGWGDSLIPLFTLAVRLVTNKNTRIERLKARELQKFGSRIMPGGDMYENHIEFLDWAARYDTGDMDMRSKARHDEWEKKLTCRRLRLNGERDLKENLAAVMAAIQDGAIDA